MYWPLACSQPYGHWPTKRSTVPTCASPERTALMQLTTRAGLPSPLSISHSRAEKSGTAIMLAHNEASSTPPIFLMPILRLATGIKRLRHRKRVNASGPGHCGWLTAKVVGCSGEGSSVEPAAQPGNAAEREEVKAFDAQRRVGRGATLQRHDQRAGVGLAEQPRDRRPPQIERAQRIADAAAQRELDQGGDARRSGQADPHRQRDAAFAQA